MRRAALVAIVLTVVGCASRNTSPDGGQATFTVSGVVSGPGKENAVVTLQGEGAARTATSNIVGIYQFLDVAAGDYTLTLLRKGISYTPSSQVVRVVAADVRVPLTTSVTAQSTSAVSGTVSGDTQSGVLVTLTRNGTTTGAALSVGGGVFRLDGVVDGAYVLTPSLAGYSFLPESLPVTVAGAAITGQDFTATGVPYAVGGTVDGDVKVGVVIKLEGNGKSREATTDAAGVYSVSGVTGGTYTLTPNLAGYTFTPASRTVKVDGAAVAGQDFTAAGVPYAVGGTVSGEVKEGVVLKLVGNGKTREATTDASGAYSVPDATKGTYTLTPTLAGYTFTPATRTVTVDVAAVAGQNFTANAVPYAVSGTVGGQTKDGVVIKLAGNGKLLQATTGANGAYSIANVTRGTYTLTPSFAGLTFVPASRTVIVTGAAVTNIDFGGTPPGWQAPLGRMALSNWYAIAASDDWKYVVAVATGKVLMYSDNYTRGWLEISSKVVAEFTNVTISNDGKFLAAIDRGHIYTSIDSGQSWQDKSPSIFPNEKDRVLSGIAMSGDGKYIAVTVQSGHLYMSGDRGASWEDKSTGPISPQFEWISIQMSNDGKYLAATVTKGHVYTSGDFGKTWLDRSSGNIAGDLDWNSIAISDDGKFLVATQFLGHLFTSSDSGVTWQDRSSGVIDGNRAWKSIAMSNDGKSIAAVVNGGNVYSSSDSGANWEIKSSGIAAGNKAWNSVAISGDGRFIGAVVYGGDTYYYAPP